MLHIYRVYLFHFRYLLHSSNFCAAGGQIQYVTEKQCKHEAEVGSDVLGQDANTRTLHIC